MNYALAKQSFHGLVDNELVAAYRGPFLTDRPGRYFVVQEREISYRFHLHQHPYVEQLTRRLLRGGTAGLQAADTDYVRKNGAFETLPDGKFRPVLHEDFFVPSYDPAPAADDATVSVAEPFPVKDLDFGYGGAYSVYNWELFYHVPLTIAIHLGKNQRFADAQRWLHFLFDPTDDGDGPTPERFWKVRPFQYTDVRKVEDLLVNLVTAADPELRDETILSIEAWKNAPFRPHVIARYRQQAYMYRTVMAYLDNLIAWGDFLFRQDTGEAIDEAMQLYVLAANILGPRPLPVPKKASVRPRTYANLRDDLGRFGSVMVDMESNLPFDIMPFPADAEAEEGRLASLRSLGKSLYFCVPRNDKLLGYWDTVADRLFKIRNSLNIQGVYRELALFEPPIDPAMLARAVAAGLDIGAVVSGLNQPLPLVRFQLLAQKATELAQEVKSLGSNLLSAMEKEDGEAIAILRARHERAVLELVEHVRYGQLQEAVKAREGLLQSLALAVRKYTFYERQLGKEPDEIVVPELEPADLAALETMKFSATEPELAPRSLDIDIASIAPGEARGTKVSGHEAGELDLLARAHRLGQLAASLEGTAKMMAGIPDIEAAAKPMGAGVATKFGGTLLSTLYATAASLAKLDAAGLSHLASMAAKVGTYARRELDWAFQSNLAAGEISQIFKQLRAAEIREAVAELELRNHRRQMEHAREVEAFLNEGGAGRTGKRTNRALYAWMKRETRGLYSQCFQLAFDVAKKAERALQHELGDPNVGFLQFGYQTGKEGLLAGEKLYLDVKRMELAYHERNRREYELTKHVSLLQVDPLALIRLRTVGHCTVRLPETIFDLDGPGHYFRRIKNVAVSIPCVAGPYASVNCTLTLLKSSIRRVPALRGGDYAREGAEDDRFSDNFSSLQSIVTSSARDDAGMFENNLRDDRYLPFEHSGVISEWRLQLPADPSRGEPAQFDYSTISDVILHVRYTAREGGAQLRRAALDHLDELVEEGRAAGTVRLFSLRHEFPSEWARFRAQAPAPGRRAELELTFRDEHYPFWSRNRLGAAARIDLLARAAGDPPPPTIDVADRPDDDGDAVTDPLVRDADMGGLLVGRLSEIPLPETPTGTLKLYFETNALDDLWIAVTWGG